MRIDYELLWDARPVNVPGEIIRILPNSRGFIRLKIPLRYLDGTLLDEVTSGQLFNFRERDSVLFTIRPETPFQRQNRESSNKKLEAENVRAATDSEIKEAVNSFQGETLKIALEQAAQAKSHAEGSELEAQAKVADYNRQLTELEDREKKISDEIDREVDKRIVPEREKLASMQQEVEIHRTELQIQEAEIAPYRKAFPFLSSRQEDTQATDSAFPENLATIWPDLLRTSGLAFRPDIATAFLVSVMAATYSGSIVLLNGSVGVGKTSLVNQAAQALGGKCDIVPVRPAWIDPSDLMGFFDPINNTFRPTPFTTALRDVTGDQIRFICLDELNLAKVENYAADLLSSVEYSRSNKKKAGEDNSAGHLKLYSKDIEKQLWEEAKDIAELEGDATRAELRRLNAIRTLVTDYPSQSPFPANAVLIGTLNSDETTYDLSPKMIDRSYVITFPPTSFEEPPKGNEYPNQQVSVTELVQRINNAIGRAAENWDDVIEWNRELQGFGIPLGHRVRRDYDVFRATGSVIGLSEHQCLGYFLFCKILPRIFFFKEQGSAGPDGSATRCKNWLEGLKSKYGGFGPVQVIDTMIQMCEDERTPTVRYWSKS